MPATIIRVNPSELNLKGQSLKASKSLTSEELTVLSETFRLLGDPSRLKILLYCMDGPKAVNQIAKQLGLSQSLVSHHLRLLRDARLVTGRREAKQIFYELADQHVSHVLLDMVEHVGEGHDANEQTCSQDRTSKGVT